MWGAVHKNLTRYEDSNYGPKLNYTAPGVYVNTTIPNDGYTNITAGTSYAVPHVTGVAALINSSKIDVDYDKDEDGDWDNDEIVEKLKEECLDLGTLGRDDYYGLGFINGWATNQRPLGDVHGNVTIDYVVDVDDVAFVTSRFGSYPGKPNWDPIADITIDNLVDVDDVTIVALHFGEYDP